MKFDLSSSILAVARQNLIPGRSLRPDVTVAQRYLPQAKKTRTLSASSADAASRPGECGELLISPESAIRHTQVVHHPEQYGQAVKFGWCREHRARHRRLRQCVSQSQRRDGHRNGRRGNGWRWWRHGRNVVSEGKKIGAALAAPSSIRRRLRFSLRLGGEHATASTSAGLSWIGCVATLAGVAGSLKRP
jgi:hypothetical protein